LTNPQKEAHLEKNAKAKEQRTLGEPHDSNKCALKKSMKVTQNKAKPK